MHLVQNLKGNIAQRSSSQAWLPEALVLLPSGKHC